MTTIIQRKIQKSRFPILIAAIALLSVSCKKAWVEKEMRAHSQHIVDHLYTDTVLAFFPEEHFSRQQLRELFSRMAMNCDHATRNGGYVKSFYTWNLNKPDEVVLTYRYRYNCDDIQFDFGYLVFWNSFELKQLRMRNKQDVEQAGEKWE